MNSYPKMHVSLYVKDISETKLFYNQFFGQEFDKEKSGYLRYTLENPSLIISFIENSEKVAASFGHLGFQVETQELMQAKLAEAKNNGFTIKEEIGVSCCYAVQDKFWVQDPSGYNWEVYYFHNDVEFSDVDSVGIDSEPAEKPVKTLIQMDTINASTCEPGSGCC